MEQRNIIISEGNRPLWQLIIASAHYTAIISLLFFFFISFEFTTEVKRLKGSFSFLELALYLLPSALYFSLVKDVLFDLVNRKYKEQYRVGPLKFGQWRRLPKIDYVSVFKQPKADGGFVYETNLWYNRNKHFNIYESDSPDAVFLMGESVAKALHVKLLDATEPNDYKWVEVE
ncbi:MAG: hypothetical protein AAFX53_14475 [Bacteroidota bacterium]